MNPFIILASTSILSLQCTSGSAELNFVLDLQAKSGELFYSNQHGSALYLSDRLTVTPNYIVFPSDGVNATINRKDSTFTRSSISGVCDVVEREESKRVF